MNVLRRSAALPLMKVMGARLVTFPVTLVCGLVWIRLVISHHGAAEYGFVALVVGLQFLLGFLDFGTSANVLEGAGRYRTDQDVEELGGILGAAWRTILVGNVVLLLVAAAVQGSRSWGPILGFPERTTSAGTAVLLILGVNILARPLSLSTALVAGLGRPAVSTWCQALSGPSSLGLLALLLVTDAPVAFLAVTPIVGQLVTYGVPFLIAVTSIPDLLPASIRGMARFVRRSVRLHHLAVPMLIIQAVGPLNDQLDRLVLSHLSTVDALATYALGAQLYSSALSFITVLTPQLWVEFAAMRAGGGPRAAILGSLGYLKRFWWLALVGGSAFGLVSHTVAPWISDGRLDLGWTLCLTFGASLTLAAPSLALGLGLTDPRSLRAQPVLSTFTTAINLTLTLVLAQPLGALGPALASLLAALVHLPLLGLLARWRLRELAATDRYRSSVTSGPPSPNQDARRARRSR